MVRRLKVFRTSIGFHDAYVAVPSRKAALAAWGAERDLFASGAAEEVTDPALQAEALDHPGEVVRKVRGTLDEHLAALGPRPERSAPAPAASPARKRSPPAPAPPPPPPRPSRTDLDRAEAELADLRADVERERTALQAELQRRLAEFDQRQARRIGSAEQRVADEQERYDERMRRWRRNT